MIDTALKIQRRPGPFHPAEHELQTFMRGALPQPEAAPVVRHLLTGCPQCLGVTRPLWELMQQKRKHLGAHR